MILSLIQRWNPFLIVECKAPSVQISQDTFDQIARYNLKLEAQILMVTNGISHYYCVMNHKKQAYEFLSELPMLNFNTSLHFGSLINTKFAIANLFTVTAVIF